MSTPLHSSNGQTSREESLVDQTTWTVIILLATLLQIKFQVANESPFETEFATIVAVIIMAEIYFLWLCAERTLRDKVSDVAEIIGDYAQLCGLLAIVLMLRLLEPTLGWINFSIWVCRFVTVTYESYDKYKKHKLKKSSKPTNGEPNESTNKEPIELRNEGPNEAANYEPNMSRNEVIDCAA